MSDERLKKIVSTESTRTNSPSIMSAPRDKKKTQKTLIIIAALIVSLALNIVLAIVSLSKNERISQMERDLKDDKTLIDELKNELSSRDSTF